MCGAVAVSPVVVTCVPGVYFVVCMALLVISLTETVLIVRLVHKQDLQTPVPDWVKYVVLERAPVLFCIHRQHRLCSRLSSQGSDLDRFKDSSYGTSKHHPIITYQSEGVCSSWRSHGNGLRSPCSSVHAPPHV